jgi:phenylalanyl-tRNA synthetase alpha chain
MDLHPLERKVLEGLKKLNGRGTADEVASAAAIEKIQAERFGYSLSQKNFVKLGKKVVGHGKLTPLGEQYVKKGLPEKRALQFIGAKKLTMADFNHAMVLDKNEMSATLGILKKNAWLAVIPGEKGPMLQVTVLGQKIVKDKTPVEIAMEKIAKGKPANEQDVKTLVRRGLADVETRTVYTLEMLPEGQKALGKKEMTAHQLTNDMLISGSWKGLKFRKYDVNAHVNPIYGGRMHPLTVAINRFRRVFLEMGFQEAAGPLVESSFWNFDALYQPQDHPARDLADTFYLKHPEKSKLPDSKYVGAVKDAHEKGTEGSTGWQYSWSEDVAKQPILRTHTTAVSARYMTKIEPPAKVFSIGRLFRNETIDYKHLPEFTQIDGIVVDENVTFKDLLGYLKEFFWKLGFEKIRFRPGYFPYTEMSVEPEVYFEEKDEWIELGGSGIFRPEVTEPLGIDVPVLAWGLGLERPLMLKLGLNDLRSFYYKNDMKWLREVPTL